MKKIKKLLTLVVVLLLVGFVGFYFGVKYEGPFRIGPPTITADVISAKFAEVSELVTVTYNYTSMGTFSNQLMFKDWKVPLTSKSFIVQYDGIIKAGIDLKQTKVETDGYNITITVPKAKILSHEIDESSVQVLDEKTNIFNPIAVDDVTGFEEEQKKLNEDTAIEKGILTEAKKNAQEALKNLILDMDGGKNYTVTFK